MTTDVQKPTPSGWQIWLMAARPATLTAAVVPVLVGTGLAVGEGRFRPFAFLAALMASLLIQVGTNLANDVADFDRGADTTGRLGPPRVTQTGLASAASVRQAMLLTFALAALCGAYLIAVAGWPVLVVGLLSIAAGIAYTGGPWPFGYNGLGDLFCFIFFGIVAVVGSYFVQWERITDASLIAAIPVACVVTAILVVNNLRDLETDRRAGKKTLAVYLGDGATRFEYVSLLLAPYACIGVAAAAKTLPAEALISFLSLPVAFTLSRKVAGGAVGPALNLVLRDTARLHLAAGGLLALGLALS